MRAGGISLAVVMTCALAGAQTVRVMAPDQVTFGRSFALVVERETGTESGRFDDAALSPLVVRLEGVDVEERAAGTIEVRRYRCWAFRRGAVEVPSADGKAPLLTLRVATSLPEGEGDVEPVGVSFGPSGLAPRLWTGATLLIAALAVIGLGFRRWARARPGPPPPSPRALAAGAIARLRAEPVSDPRDDARQAAAILRRFLMDGQGIAGPASTAADLRALHPAASDVLLRCELVLHAGLAETTEQRAERIDALEALVGEP